jgi:hypothetical protein
MEDDWKAEVRLGLENLVDRAMVTGANQADVFAVVDEELARLRVALDKDPDPAEDGTPEMIEEPANDWPAASLDETST